MTSAGDALLPSDTSLLRRLRTGDQDAATRLYFRYADRLRQLARAQCSPDLARRVDLDDIVQSVFSSFFRGIGKGYYDVPAGEELWKLLLVIALNKIRAKGAYHRAARRDVRQTVEGLSLKQQPDENPDDAGSPYSVLKMTIEELVEALPELQRLMINLRIEGYEVAEIAEKVHRSKRTVERNLKEFRNKLSEYLS
jgi:RNA polymerase sigma-70 factor (ECF subfamily)